MSPTHFKVKSLSGKIFTSVLAFTLAVIVALSVGTSEVQNMLKPSLRPVPRMRRAI